MDVFQRQIKKCIRSFKNESIYKEKMKNFFVNKNLYKHIRMMLIRKEIQDPIQKPESKDQNTPTVTFKENASIFGINNTIGFSRDYLANLQPNYFKENGIGRKSKYASTFNIRKQPRQGRQSNIDTVLTVESGEFQASKIPNNSEPVFMFDHFFRLDAEIILEKKRQREESGPYKFSFKNIFNFKKTSNLSKNETLSDLGSFDDHFTKISIKNEIDKRASFSLFKYETGDSIMINELTEKTQEDSAFVQFFFDVSNSQMIENIEKFLSNYLTLSKRQKETFSKSNVRRKSLQSVLSILKHSEGGRNDTLFSKLMGNESFENLGSGKINHSKQIRLKLLKNAFTIKKKPLKCQKRRCMSEDLLKCRTKYMR